MPRYYRFTATGTDPFPVDMLRRVPCWPASEVDSRLVGESLGDEGHLPRRMIVLECSASSSMSEARWDSYGWRVYDLTRVK